MWSVRPQQTRFHHGRSPFRAAAILADAESVERLIRALEANKPLLPEKPKDEAAN